VKKEYEEKQKKKKEKEEKGDKKDDKKDEKKDDKKDGDEEKQNTQNKTEPTQEGVTTSPVEEEEEPRVFELKIAFYQQRLNRKRQAEIAKRNRERMRDPTFFPSVPKNLP
jgi:hypothetical protein